MAPFDGSGNYALSDTIAPATNADANELQAILDDIAVALDKCVVADGQSTVTGTIKAFDGTAPLPGYTFSSDLNSGFYRIGADNIGLSLGGTKRIDFGTAGTTITGTFSATTLSGTLPDGQIVSSTDAGAAQGPTLDLFRDSASPAVSDAIGGIDFNGRDSAGNKQLYARLVPVIQDPVSTTEDASLFCQVVVAGATTTIWSTQGAAFDVQQNAIIHGTTTTTGADTAGSYTTAGAISGATAAGAMLATQAEQETGSATDKLVTPGRQQFHPSAAKHWGFVTYSAGTPTLQASYNITSITDTATGRLTVTIATDFSSANWACTTGVGGSTTSEQSIHISDGTLAAGSVEISFTNNSGSLSDANAVHWHGFGDQ